MSTKKPELSDFGISPAQYALYKDKRAVTIGGCAGPLLSLFSFILVGVSVSFFTNFIVGAITGITFGLVLAVGVQALVDRFIKSRILNNSIVSQIKLYEEADRAYRVIKEETEREQREAERTQQEAELARQEAERASRRKLYDHWMSLSGSEFERELGILYAHLGYRVESTPSSGDQGIDLILRKDDETTIVQCKSHKSPVGPAVARELLGSLVAFGADDAVLACTGGFTRGVYEFVRGKPMIKLISASELVQLSRRVENDIQHLTSSPPYALYPAVGRP